MRKFKGADPAQYSTAGTNRKLISMGILLVLLVGALIWQQGQAARRGAADSNLGPTLGEGVVEVPDLLPGTLDAIADGTPDERVQLEEGPLQVTRAHVRQFTRSMFERAGVGKLDAALVESILAAPAEYRGTNVQVRGQILALDAFEVPGSTNEELRGSLLTTDGATVHFIALRLGRHFLDIGDWARMEGLVFKVHRAPIDGTFTDAPLVVSPRLQQSVPDLGPVAGIEPALWSAVQDDTLADQTGLPEDMRWRLLSYVRDLQPEAIDWNAAPVLDAQTMDAMVSDGSAFRGQAFRVPVTKIFDITAKAIQEDNPANLDYLTEAWIASEEWNRLGSNPMFQAIGPGEHPLAEGLMARVIDGVKPLVEAKVIFFKTVAFESNGEVLRLAPSFALVELRTFTAPPQRALKQLLYGFIALAIFLGLLIASFVRKDRKSSAAMQEKLVERRRKRRKAMA